MFCPNVVFETLELYINIVRRSRGVRPVVAVVVLCPSVRPVVVRPLSVRPVVSLRRRRRPLPVSPSRYPSRRCRPLPFRPSRRPSNYCLHDVA